MNNSRFRSPLPAFMLPRNSSKALMFVAPRRLRDPQDVGNNPKTRARHVCTYFGGPVRLYQDHVFAKGAPPRFTGRIQRSSTSSFLGWHTWWLPTALWAAPNHPNKTAKRSCCLCLRVRASSQNAALLALHMTPNTGEFLIPTVCWHLPFLLNSN